MSSHTARDIYHIKILLSVLTIIIMPFSFDRCFQLYLSILYLSLLFAKNYLRMRVLNPHSFTDLTVRLSKSIFYSFISLDYNYHTRVVSSTSLSIIVCAELFHIIFAIIHLSIRIYISNFRVHNGARWHFASTLPIYLYCHASARGGSTTRDARNYSRTGRDFRGLAADIDVDDSAGKSMEIPN